MMEGSALGETHALGDFTTAAAGSLLSHTLGGSAATRTPPGGHNGNRPVREHRLQTYCRMRSGQKGNQHKQQDDTNKCKHGHGRDLINITVSSLSDILTHI